MALSKAQIVRDHLKTGSFTLDEIHTATGVPKKHINTYLWLDEKRGAVVRSGDRGKYRWTASGAEASPAVAEQNGTGGDGRAGEISPEAQGERG